jgi:aminoglycoside phosphotransferase (APT) family kinase protein
MTDVLGDHQAVEIERPVALATFIEQSELQSIVIGTSKDANAKVSIVLVSPQTGAPVLVVKAPTTDRAALAVDAERRTLVALHDRLPDAIRATVPRVVSTVDFQGRSAMVTTMLAGVPMARGYLRRPARATSLSHFAAIGSWLETFQSETADGAAAIDMNDGVHRRLASRYADDPALPGDLERLGEIHQHLSESTVARMAVHGDLWFGNALLTRTRITGVVDWEDGRLRGEPVRDLVRFALAYALYLDRATARGRPVRGYPGLRASGWGSGIEFAFTGSGWFPELFRSFLQQGLVRLGGPASLWRDAALAGLAEIAASTDDLAFGTAHLRLFRRLCATTAQAPNVPDAPGGRRASLRLVERRP